MPKIVELILWIAYPFCGLWGWYYFVKYRFEERRQMMEKGIGPAEDFQTRSKPRSTWLKLGIVILGIGLGFLVIALLINFEVIGHSDAIYPAILCVSGGGSLIVASCLDFRKK